jgi:hypothetical protein
VVYVQRKGYKIWNENKISAEDRDAGGIGNAGRFLIGEFSE